MKMFTEYNLRGILYICEVRGSGLTHDYDVRISFSLYDDSFRSFLNNNLTYCLRYLGDHVMILCIYAFVNGVENHEAILIMKQDEVF